MVDYLDPMQLPWQRIKVWRGMPQLFQIGDHVKLRQDSSAPREWAADLAGERMQIVGVRVDEHRPGRVCYYTLAHGIYQWAEDWLELAV